MVEARLASHDGPAIHADSGLDDHLEAALDADQDEILAPLTNSRIPGIAGETPFHACIRPYIEALGWTGADRNLVEAIPHLEPIARLEDLRTTLMRLGFRTRVHRAATRQLDPEELPVIAMLGATRPVVILEQVDTGTFLAFDGEAMEFVEIAKDARPLLCCFPVFEAGTDQTQKKNTSWFADAMHRIRGPIAALFGLTFFANVLALATPLYVMQVYNVVINAKALDTLAFLLAGMLGILGLELYLRRVRGDLIAYIGTRISTNLMINGFERVLGLPIRMIEAAPVNAQVMRLKQFEGIYGFFSGPMATAALDLPFVIMFFAAIALLSPVLALVPIALVIVFMFLVAVSLPISKRNMQTNGDAHSARQSFLIDAITNQTTIAQLRAEPLWRKRFITPSRAHAMAAFRMQFFETMLGNVAQMLVMVAGIMTLLIGTNLVIAGDLSIGGLIAVMMLVWRVLSPVQTVFLSVNRINQLMESIRQVNQLMRIPLERPQKLTRSVFRPFEGHIVFDSVAFRYMANGTPVFRNLTFEIAPGELIGVASASSSGRSTLLKLILGLYRPQSGQILLDGLNLAQHDPHEVRASIGNTPLDPVFFYGTIAQNMRLSAPTATDAVIRQALVDAGIPPDSEIFPDGLETRLTDQKLMTLPAGVKQCLSLARMYCKNANINLLNDPAAHLDENGDRALVRKLQALRGKSTVVIVTNTPHQLEICDRVFVLKGGMMTEADPAAVAAAVRADISSTATAPPG
ncbi:MAG: ABC transporter transmembrane domain-containing protein [Pseudomonadota bacterium]